VSPHTAERFTPAEASRIERQSAILKLLDRDGRAIYARLWRLTGSADAAEDLLQDLVLRLSQSRGFDAADRPGAFAHRVATNLALDWRRAERRRKRLAEQTTHRRPAAPAAPGPAEQAQAGERVAAMLNALAELRPQDREVLTMRYLDELDYESMARRLGKTAHQVRGLCAGAMRRLRNRVHPRAVWSASGPELKGDPR
jgi:RNA polymerase sigma-70 factor (ECF subfamily)